MKIEHVSAKLPFWEKFLSLVIIVVMGAAVYGVFSYVKNEEVKFASLENTSGTVSVETQVEAKNLYGVDQLANIPTSSDDPVPIPEVGAYWGIYVDPGEKFDFTDQGRRKAIEDRERTVGRNFVIDRQFYTWGKTVPSEYDKWTVAEGRIPHISLKGPLGDWKGVANGNHDDYINKVARGLRDLDAPVFFTFHHEPENDIPQMGSATDYKNAFRHVAKIIDDVGADNVAMTTVSIPWFWESNPSRVEEMYPGDDVVDWIGTDPYNFFTRDGKWKDLSDAFDTWYDWCVSKHPDKPLLFGEWGTNIDPRNPGREVQWFENVLNDLKTNYPAIKAIEYFDANKKDEDKGNNWLIDQTSSMLNAFIDMGNDIYFDPLFGEVEQLPESFEISVPTNLSLTPGDGEIHAKWSANPTGEKVEGYKLRYRQLGADSWNFTGQHSSPEYTIEKLINDTKYEVQVRAFDKDANLSDWTATAVATPMAAVIEEEPAPNVVLPPEDITLAASTNALSVAWERYDGAIEYAIQFKKSSDSGYTWLDRTKDNSYLITGLSSATSYDVQVRTVISNSNKSDWSDPVTATTDTDEDEAQVPTNIRAWGRSSYIYVDWNDNAQANFKTYALRYRQSGGDWVWPGRTTSSRYLLKNLKTNKKYEIQVRSVLNGEIKSDYSDSIFVQL